MRSIPNLWSFLIVAVSLLVELATAGLLVWCGVDIFFVLLIAIGMAYLSGFLQGRLTKNFWEE